MQERYRTVESQFQMDKVPTTGTHPGSQVC